MLGQIAWWAHVGRMGASDVSKSIFPAQAQQVTIGLFLEIYILQLVRSAIIVV